MWTPLTPSDYYGIAQLVRVSLGDRLCGLNVFISHVISLSWDDFSPLVLSPEQ